MCYKSKMKDEILSAKSITIKSLKSLETLDFVLSPWIGHFLLSNNLSSLVALMQNMFVMECDY